ncbi:hypothetical protein D3C77_351320 [compost metagenome]
MTLAELNTALRATGYPVAYSHFKSEVTPPYIAYLFAYSSDLIADNTNFLEIGNFQVELYTEIKDLTAEGKVQTVLKNLDLPYSKSETFIDDEKLFQIIYEIQLIGA